MSVLRNLTGSAYGTHFADQIALVSVPLVAAVAFGATPEMIGVLVACQSMAHLLGSIPFGVMVDQKQLRTLAMAATLTSGFGFAGAALAILQGSILWFGAAITLAGFGVVLFTLTALSILPRSVPPGGLAKANAAIELPRALCTFAVPLVIGFVIGGVPAWAIFAAASIGAFVALGLTSSLPRFGVVPKDHAAPLARILEGGRYVLGHRLLLPISLCAVFWNLAFAALLVVLVPAIQDVYALSPGSFGFALSAFGLAAVAGSWLYGRLADRIAPAVILLFGPGSSLVASAGLWMTGPDTSLPVLLAWIFLLGFGPSMWLVAQNSVRQIVTPPDMLGRVNAVIQTTIYGIRPLGALIGGLVAGSLGPQAGLALVVGAFALSFLAAAFSDLRSVISFASLARRSVA